MSDVDVNAGDGEDGEADAGKRRLSGKKLVLLYILPTLLLLAAGGAAGAYFFLLAPPADGEAPATVADEGGAGPATARGLVFYNLPHILVNLNSGGRQNSYLKIAIALELEDDDDLRKVEAVLPRIIDTFQIYLRELRIEDLSGSAGPMLLKEELLARIHASTGAPKVNDILFKEFLVQ